jgi:hypothetical protein
MLGPLLVVIAGSYTIWLSFVQSDALVVGDYYKQGKAINQDLRRDRAASALGLSVDLRYDPASGTLSGKLASHAAPYSEKMTVRLVHSTLPEKDLQFSVNSGADGSFTIPLPMLDMARWQVVVENQRRDWRLEGSWGWPAQQKVRIESDAPASK